MKKMVSIQLFLVVLCMGMALYAQTPQVTQEGEYIRVLIVDGQNNHNWLQTTPVLKRNLEEVGIFKVDVATTPGKHQDMSGFKPNFSAYHAVVMNYNGDEWPEETKKALEMYISGGGGLVIFHAANNAFPKWVEFNKMAGVGGWGNRNEKSGPYLYWEKGKTVRDTSPGNGGGHGPQHEFQITIREANHPITKGLPAVFMHSTDELYERLRGPAENVTILATAYADPAKRGSGRHEPQLMVIHYGKGRVFHIAYGHAGEQCRSVAFIVPFTRGTEWAATGDVSIPVPGDMPLPNKAIIRK